MFWLPAALCNKNTGSLCVKRPCPKNASKGNKQPPSCTWCCADLESTGHLFSLLAPEKNCRASVLYAVSMNNFLWMNSFIPLLLQKYHEVNLNQWTKVMCQLDGIPSVPHSRWLFLKVGPVTGPRLAVPATKRWCQESRGVAVCRFLLRQSFSRKTEASRLELEQKDWKQKAYINPYARVEFKMCLQVYTAAKVALVPCCQAMLQL